MELTTDAVKVLASKLNPESLNTLMSTSKAVRDIFNTALSDDYTYKLMTEELLGTDLPEFTNHSWKDVYDFFIAKSERPKLLYKGEIHAWKSMSHIRQRLNTALYSSDPVIVKIALFLGMDPSVTLNSPLLGLLGTRTQSRSNMPLMKALSEDNTEVARLLLSDERVLESLNIIMILPAFSSGNVETISLVLNNPRINIAKSDKTHITINLIKSGNVKALKFVVDELHLTLNGSGWVPDALTCKNPDIVIYLLDKEEVPYDEEEFISDIDNISSIDEEVLAALLHHPRIIPMIEANKHYLLWHLIKRNMNKLAEELLEDSTLDTSSQGYELFLKAIKKNNIEILKKLIDRPEVKPDAKMSVVMLTSAKSMNSLNVLLNSERIALTEKSSSDLIFYFSGLKTYMLPTILNNEKVVINREIATKALGEVLMRRNLKGIEILMNHPRTRIYYNEGIESSMLPTRRLLYSSSESSEESD